MKRKVGQDDVYLQSPHWGCIDWWVTGVGTLARLPGFRFNRDPVFKKKKRWRVSEEDT